MRTPGKRLHEIERESGIVGRKRVGRRERKWDEWKNKNLAGTKTEEKEN